MRRKTRLDVRADLAGAKDVVAVIASATEEKVFAPSSGVTSMEGSMCWQAAMCVRAVPFRTKIAWHRGHDAMSA